MRASPRFVITTALVSGVALAAALLLGTSSAQGFPNKPVRILVPLSVGSQTDILARMIAQKMSENWRQPVIVDNRPGGAGAIAGAILVKAAPDGHTLMVHSDGHAVSAALYAAKLPYDTLRDMTRVSLLATLTNVLVVAPSLGPKSVKDLIAIAKAKPGQLSFGSAGTGGGLHFTGEMFKLAAGIEAVHVPFKGLPEALADTVTARIHFTFSALGPAVPFIKSGRLLALAVASAQRSPALPDVPTMAEAALPGFSYDLWAGMFAPANTPRPIIEQISVEVARIMQLPDVKEQLLNQGLVYRPNTPEAFDRFVRAQVEELNKVIKVAGIQAQ